MPYKDKEKRKEAAKKYSLKYYNSNKEKVVILSRTRKEKLKQEFEDFKRTLKCSKCDENHISCLEFHHLNPNEKDMEISNMIGYSKERLERELKKCIVLCSNCHRKLHYNEKDNK